MTNVNFNSGVESFDAVLNGIQGLANLFQAVNLNRLGEKAKLSKGQPILWPTDIEVAPFTDVDDNMTYAITSYLEMDCGRMKISDFQVKQRWAKIAGANVLRLVDGDNSIILGDLGDHTLTLALTADAYRVAHFASQITEE